MLADLTRGARDVVRAAALLARHPRLLVWVITPFVLTLALFGVLGGLALARVDDLLAAAALLPPGWLGRALLGLLYVIVVVGLILAFGFLFFAVASLVAAPFKEPLSEAVEEVVTGRSPPPFSAARLARDLVLTIAHESRRVLIYLLATGALLVVALVVPGVGWLLYAVGGGLLAARFAAYDALDATMARRGWSYVRKREFLRAHRARTLGLGGAVAAAALVPILNALAVSLGVVGGTLLFLDATRPADGNDAPSTDRGQGGR